MSSLIYSPLIPLEENTHFGPRSWLFESYFSASQLANCGHMIKNQQMEPTNSGRDNFQVLPWKESGCHLLPSPSTVENEDMLEGMAAI